MKHPMQKIKFADDGVIRFVQNDIISYLVDIGAIDLNKLAVMEFSKADRRQLSQLIGYSVSGYGGLSHAAGSKSMYRADEIAARMADENKQLREELANFKHDPKCTSCGHPKSNHPYRHPFVAVALGEDS
jgi:hypothetical protein